MSNSRNNKLILASGSSIRKQLLQRVGLSFSCVASKTDESELIAGAQAEITTGNSTIACIGKNLASQLARLKGATVSKLHPQAIVIAADQTGWVANQLLTKTGDPVQLQKNFVLMQQNPHFLYSHVAVYRNSRQLWQYGEQASLWLRQLQPDEINQYLQREQKYISRCLGGYRFEAYGLNLFDKVKGDYFTILGLPLLPLINFLRTLT